MEQIAHRILSGFYNNESFRAARHIIGGGDVTTSWSGGNCRAGFRTWWPPPDAAYYHRAGADAGAFANRNTGYDGDTGTMNTSSSTTTPG